MYKFATQCACMAFHYIFHAAVPELYSSLIPEKCLVYLENALEYEGDCMPLTF